jgi:ABC-type polysaccharide/polyol phosphate transport system ATPase subunit
MGFKIYANNIYKDFEMNLVQDKGILLKMLSIFRKKEKKKISALKDVSFEINSGENVGIIGRNASGKSTLLRIIAGIYSPSNGKISMEGKLVYLTGFGQGLKQRLTMKENIYLLGSLMGLSKRDIKKKFDEIVEFSELKDYVNAKIYQFSSGMTARLNFSIGVYCLTHHNPDILLLDEVFESGGDASFREKAIKKMESIVKKGAIVVIVSHNLNIIKKYCHKVIWLDNGRIIKIGSPKEVIDMYLKSVRG